MSEIVTRIAPSPTGYMHIGTARTALFNWLYARGRGGKFLLRVEDTDKERSTNEATQAIFKGMKWLGLDFDGEVVYQADQARRHVEIARHLLVEGKAYKCFSTQEEISTFRRNARKDGQSTLFRSPWRDTPAAQHPDGPFVIRIKAPQNGKSIIEDKVQGNITIRNDQLDDMVLLRSDGTPVYMLAVVVDDHDMGVTHVIRGDDHLNNAARQMLIYHAMDWPLPVYAHIPLIFSEDGKKLSKRSGATSLEEYQQMGYPASGMRNYLARLGWSHGNDEFFTDEMARDWFDLSGVVKSPARLDFKKLQNLCGKHIAKTEDAVLLNDLSAYCKISGREDIQTETKSKVLTALHFTKKQAKTYLDLLEKSHFCITQRPVIADEKSANLVTAEALKMINTLTPHLENAIWERETLEASCKFITDAFNTSFGKLAGPLRAVIAGRSVAPSIIDMMLVLGKKETVARLKDVENRYGILSTENSKGF